MPLTKINNDSLFLSFNYTDTLETTYKIPTEQILYIHGKALRNDELILGHHDETLFQNEPIPQFNSEEEREMYYDVYAEDVRMLEAREVIKDYFRDTYKDTASRIQANSQFFKSLNHIGEIYIYGHSLSPIDFDYFYEIKKYASPNCQWYISYHDELELYNAHNFAQKLGIQNYQLIKF